MGAQCSGQGLASGLPTLGKLAMMRSRLTGGPSGGREALILAESSGDPTRGESLGAGPRPGDSPARRPGPPPAAGCPTGSAPPPPTVCLAVGEAHTSRAGWVQEVGWGGGALLLVSKGGRLGLGQGPWGSAHRPVTPPRTGPLTPRQQPDRAFLGPLPREGGLDPGLWPVVLARTRLPSRRSRGPAQGRGSGNAAASGPQAASRLWGWEVGGGRGVLPGVGGGGPRGGQRAADSPRRQRRTRVQRSPVRLVSAAAITMATTATPRAPGEQLTNPGRRGLGLGGARSGSNPTAAEPSP